MKTLRFLAISVALFVLAKAGQVAADTVATYRAELQDSYTCPRIIDESERVPSIEDELAPTTTL